MHDDELHQYHSAQFSADASRVVTVARNAAQVWNARTGRAITAPLQHPLRLNAARFSPDGQRVVTSCADGWVRVWDVETGHLLMEPLRHRDAVWYAEFSPDGRRVLSASMDGTARVWDLPLVPLPIPGWLPDLAEAVAGQRFISQDQAQTVPLERLIQMKERLRSEIGSDSYARWAQWFVADNATRTISPVSSITVQYYVKRRTQEDTLPGLQEAVRLSPTNLPAQARLATALLGTNSPPGSRQAALSDWQSRRATGLAPKDPDVWWARARTCDNLGELPEALEAMERARSLNANSGAFWNDWGRILEKTNRWDDALQAYTKAVEMAGTSGGHFTFLALALKNQSRLLKQQGKLLEAAAANLRAFNLPPRPTGMPPHLIDLSAYYDRGLDLAGAVADFTLMPAGRVTLDESGIEFDVRGAIRLRGGLVERAADTPEIVAGIRVQRKCRFLHFLHVGRVVGDSPLPEGAPVCLYRMWYVDGQQREMPIRYGHQIRSFYTTFDPKPLLDANTKVAWSNATPGKMPIRLFHTTWENTRPDVAIATIDFIGIGNSFTPCLFAITAEP